MPGRLGLLSRALGSEQRRDPTDTLSLLAENGLVVSKLSNVRDLALTSRFLGHFGSRVQRQTCAASEFTPLPTVGHAWQLRSSDLAFRVRIQTFAALWTASRAGHVELFG